MKHLKAINHYFLKYKWHFLGGILFVALSTIFGTYQGVIVRNGTNQISQIGIFNGFYQNIRTISTHKLRTI